MNLVITGKTTTSNEKAVSGNILLCYMSMWKTTLLSANRDDNETRPQRKITTIGGKLKKTSSETGTQVLRECFSGEKQCRQSWRQSLAGNETRFRTCWLGNTT